MSISRCNSLLVANRGEIARRIIRTCRTMGIRVVAVYSDADAASLYVEEADAAVRIGPPPPTESYLNIPAILDAARRSGVDAVHPGFGFLAENADFARACAELGLTFIGPPVEAIAAMGDKRAARELAERVGVPVIPGYQADQSDEALARATESIGYPVMVKAAMGGGGKGMRLVHEPAALADALAGARREAGSAFGSGDLLLERALLRPRHVEIQVLGDQHGHILHLGERECSIQRRHQKVIEESPSPVVTPGLRAEMGAAAVALAEAVGYTGAGTVEFLLDSDAFYFLEMNTRLQVEHPVTEMVTGIDLVEWQIRIAEGEALPWRQDEIQLRGHAIEARVYAENTANDFLPATGPVLLWRPPAADGLRVDDGIRSGDEVTIHYDPMLAKIVAHGRTRADAVRRLRRALEQSVLLGLTNNLGFLAAVLNHPVFIKGELSTHFLADYPLAGHVPDDEERVIALIAAALACRQRDAGDGPGYWRNNPGRPAPYLFEWDDRPLEVYLFPLPRTANEFMASFSADGENPSAVSLTSFAGPDMGVTVDGVRRAVVLAERAGEWWVQVGSSVLRLRERPLLPKPHRAVGAGGSLRAPMPGTVLAVLVEIGQAVEAGQPLMKLEAMKMEHTIRAAAAGIVEALYHAAGEQVAADSLLARIAAVAPDGDPDS